MVAELQYAPFTILDVVYDSFNCLTNSLSKWSVLTNPWPVQSLTATKYKFNFVLLSYI